MKKYEPNYYSLAGEWGFYLDTCKDGHNKKVYSRDLPDSVILPGTTDENRKGVFNKASEINHLTRIYPYKGYAWYQRIIESSGARDKHVRLFLERTKISHVWIDDQYIGSCDSMCAPHLYDLPYLPSGKHRLTILVDNENLPPVGDCHQLSEHTQTNWNGIVGRIELQVFYQVFINDIQVFPDVEGKKIKVLLSIKNMTGNNITGNFRLSAGCFNGIKKHKTEPHTYSERIPAGDSLAELEYVIGDGVLLWDEFSPYMYELLVELQADLKGRTLYDSKVQEFGMRKFSAQGTQFEINGRTVFLRGTHDACVFPKTGYAPMSTDEWVRIFNIAKSYGLNHYRFHSWCPPEAAFRAADITGVYLQPELPNWASFLDPSDKDYSSIHNEYLKIEGHRILKTFGNHPSFVMFSLGNELFGSRIVMSELINEFRAYDGRHLYAQGSNNFYQNPSLPEGDDFWVTMRTNGNAPVRGSFSFADLPLGHIQSRNSPSTMFDYSGSIRNIPVPVIGHEIGQYESFPDFNEIEQYTGVLRARNLEVFRRRLEDKGLLEQAKAFMQASGKLAVICYREEIETALRTPGFGGFQLLDIKDFPGQGTAIVGVLNAFMNSKGFIEPEEWREFCSDAVLLARIPKYTYNTGENLSADIEMAYYGDTRLEGVTVEWKILNKKYGCYASGEFRSIDINQGGLTSIGTINVATDNIKTPETLSLELALKNSRIMNHYPVWVYPTPIDNNIPEHIKVCNHFDDNARQFLTDGYSVLLFPHSISGEHCVEGMFASDFWCYPMFRDICMSKGLKPSPGTLGILCDPTHPALESFPTEFHSNWQWWSIIINSRPTVLDSFPGGFKPIVQVIDNFERNHKLGLLFEAAVGKGKLLVCSSNLTSCMDKPETRQFLHSLLKYMQSDNFKPEMELDISFLEEIFG